MVKEKVLRKDREEQRKMGREMKKVRDRLREKKYRNLERDKERKRSKGKKCTERDKKEEREKRIASVYGRIWFRK